MKRSLFIVVLIFVFFSLNALYRDLDLPPAPSYEFSIAPVLIAEDQSETYMFGDYRGTCMTLQPDIVLPGVETGGVYMVYHSKDSNDVNRCVYYAYYPNNGDLQGSNIFDNDQWSGFASISIDEETGIPLVAYHGTDNISMGVFITIDNFYAEGIGNWLTEPFEVINNSELQENGIINFDDTFVFPIVKIGASPISNKRRLYISAENYNELSSNRFLLAYADFDEEDLQNSDFENWDWHYNFINIENIQQGDYNRVNATFSVKDNKVVYFGNFICSTNSVTNSGLFALTNENYGEGGFQDYIFDYHTEWEINDAQNLDGSWLYGGSSPANLRWTSFATFKMNSIFVDENTVSFPGALAVEYLNNENSWYYKPEWGHIPVVQFFFDVQNHTFSAKNIYPAATLSNANVPNLPWDLDMDGEADSYDENGNVQWVKSLPLFYTDLDESFHTGLFRITKSDNSDFSAVVWADCYEAYMNYIGEDGYASWNETDKIMIATKNADIWNTPIKITANEEDVNYNSNIQGMKPAYIYTADKIKLINGTNHRIYLFFLDEDEYSMDSSGDLYFAAIDIGSLSNEQNQIPNVNPLEVSNYPNPFNPQTTIKYNLPENGNVTLEVFNLKGQKVKTLVNQTQKSGEHSIIWDGKDDNARNLTSGIYFYKIKQGKFTSTKKMILMK